MQVILVDAINTLVIPEKGIYSPLFDLLEEYPNRKIVLTGANDKEFSYHGLDKLPYEVFTLKHNPEKSDPKYYEILMLKYKFEVENLIYIEHNLEAIKSAESLNLKVFHYDKDMKDIKKLKIFLDYQLIKG